MRLYYDDLAGEYLEIGFRLCFDNTWRELHRCLAGQEFQLLVLGQPRIRGNVLPETHGKVCRRFHLSRDPGRSGQAEPIQFEQPGGPPDRQPRDSGGELETDRGRPRPDVRQQGRGRGRRFRLMNQEENIALNPNNETLIFLGSDLFWTWERNVIPDV